MSSFHRYLLVSLALHSLILFLFVFHLPWQTREWGGGEGNEGEVEVVMVELEKNVFDEESRNWSEAEFRKVFPSAGPLRGEREASGQWKDTVNTFGRQIGQGGQAAGQSAPDTLHQIRQRISAAKQYPLQAKRRGIEGIVGVAFSLSPDGGVQKVGVTQSSGFQILDDEALDTIKRGIPYPYYAGDISLSLKFDLKD